MFFCRLQTGWCVIFKIITLNWPNIPPSWHSAPFSNDLSHREACMQKFFVIINNWVWFCLFNHVLKSRIGIPQGVPLHIYCVFIWSNCNTLRIFNRCPFILPNEWSFTASFNPLPGTIFHISFFTSPDQLIFGLDMVIPGTYLTNWCHIYWHRRQNILYNNARENRCRIEHDYIRSRITSSSS